jgi:hypothetical protein
MDVSEAPTASIIRTMMVLKMEAISTAETLVSFYQTTLLSIPGDGRLQL